MDASISDPSTPFLIEVEDRPTACLLPGCGGTIVRRPLGNGQSAYRCSRCFRRYRVRDVADQPGQGRLRRMIREFVTWQEDPD
jgi:hypothetical protein